MNDTCLIQYDFTGLEYFTNFSYQQISAYCNLYASFSRFDTAIDQTIGYSMAIIGIVGFISYIFTYLTFSNSSIFSGPSFLYHRAMAIIELIHMLIMCQYGVLRLLNFPGGGYSMIFWRDCAWGGWMIGDSAKLCINCLTTFVSLERTVAVWLPLKFDTVNRYNIVSAAILVAILIGSLQLTSLGSYRVGVAVGGQYSGELTRFGSSQFYGQIQQAIYMIKLVLGGCTFALCGLVALGMYRSNRRVSQMSADVQHRWKLVKMACYLQLIVAVSALIDHVTWVAFKMVDQPYPIVGRNAMLWLRSYDQAVHDLDRMRTRSAFEVTQVLAGEIDHGCRFYLYLIFHASFRESFKNLLDRTHVTNFSRGASKSVVAPTSHHRA